MASDPNPIPEDAEEHHEKPNVNSGIKLGGEVISGTHPTNPAPMLARRSRRKPSLKFPK